MYSLAYHRNIEKINAARGEKDRHLILKLSKELGRTQVSAQVADGRCEGSTRRFIKGFLSSPESWWAANIQISACSGALGKVQQRHAWERQQVLSALAYSYIHNMSRGTDRIYELFNLKLQSNISGLIGRLAGGALVTNRALFGQGAKTISSGYAKFGYAMGTGAISFLYTFFGQAVLGVARGIRNLEELVQFALTGAFVGDSCINLNQTPNRQASELTKDDKKMIDDFFVALYELSKSLEAPAIPVSEFDW